MSETQTLAPQPAGDEAIEFIGLSNRTLMRLWTIGILRISDLKKYTSDTLRSQLEDTFCRSSKGSKEITIILEDVYRALRERSYAQPTLDECSTTSAQQLLFIEAYNRYHRHLFNYANMRTGNVDAAHDLVQETLLRVWEQMSTGFVPDNCKAFLFKVLRNIIIDEWRKKKEVGLDVLLGGVECTNDDEDGLTPSHPDLICDERDAIERSIDVSRLAPKAIKLLRHLPIGYRRVLALRYLNELGPSEIADEIGLSVNVISVRIHRGMKILQDYMGYIGEAREELDAACARLNGLIDALYEDDSISERNKDVFVQLYGLEGSLKKRTLEHVAECFEMTRELVQQVVIDIWDKLRASGFDMDHESVVEELARIRVLETLTGKRVSAK